MPQGGNPRRYWISFCRKSYSQREKMLLPRKKPMFHIILYQPEIPPNTGNIIRLCANVGAHLHLVEPLGFDFDDARLRRAALDYRDLARVSRYPDWHAFMRTNPEQRVWAFSSHAKTRYDRTAFKPGDGLLFGPETRGLPADVLAALDSCRLLRLPMQPRSRSLNLSNSVAIALYEALRQNRFDGLE
jgi:tRNA (cytidine/uridine-2'-O-)-methyltransferase